jgi:hypothetical protein
MKRSLIKMTILACYIDFVGAAYAAQMMESQHPSKQRFAIWPEIRGL